MPRVRTRDTAAKWLLGLSELRLVKMQLGSDRVSEEQDWVEKIIRNGIEAGKSNIAILQKLDDSTFKYDVERATRLIGEWRKIKQ